MESKFKVGDRVIRPAGDLFGEDYVFTIEQVIEAVNKIKLKGINGTYYAGYFKLYKEEPVKQFDMHTQPWFIRVNNEQEFHLVQEWLKENFGKALVSRYKPEFIGVTNTSNNGDVCDWIYFLTNRDIDTTKRHEIKVNFKTIIDSVEWPVVESEKDKKIRELKETIEAATKQIKELEEM